MAKETKNDEIQVQEPEAPKKDKKPGISLPLILGIIFGGIILLFLLVRFMILPYMVENMNPEAQKIKAQLLVEEKKNEMASGVTRLSAEFLEKQTKTLMTGRITTNPKNSPQFVVIDIATMYVPKDEEVAKELAKEGGKESKEPGVISPAFMSTMIRIKGVVNKILGSMTVEELQSKRDTLATLFKTQFKPLFYEKNCLVRDVVVQEFIIQ